MFQTNNWGVYNSTTQAGCTSSVENEKKIPPNVDTTTAEYVEKEAEEEKKM